MTDKIKTLPERLNEIAEMLMDIADEIAGDKKPSTADETLDDSGSNPPGDKPPTPPGTGL